MDVGIYVIQAACRAALAQPVAVTARELPKTKPELFNEVEETIEWEMEFPGGATCRASSSYARNSNVFEARGEGGWIRMEPAYAYRGIRAQTSRGTLRYADVHQQSRHIDDFAAGVLAGRESPVPGEMGRDHMRVIDAIYYSAAHGGRRVPVAAS
jgi:predicted dehydrogenase